MKAREKAIAAQVGIGRERKLTDSMEECANWIEALQECDRRLINDV